MGIAQKYKNRKIDRGAKHLGQQHESTLETGFPQQGYVAAKPRDKQSSDTFETVAGTKATFSPAATQATCEIWYFPNLLTADVESMYRVGSDQSMFDGKRGLQEANDRLEGRFAVFVVVAEVGEEKRNPGVLEIMLSIVGIILGRIGEEGRFWWEDRVEFDHASDGAVQARGSSCRYRILLQAIQDGCEGMVVAPSGKHL